MTAQHRQNNSENNGVSGTQQAGGNIGDTDSRQTLSHSAYIREIGNNITMYPERVEAHDAKVLSDTELTFGDLHANPIKLLYSLIREGVVKMPTEDYQSLVSLYDEFFTYKLQKDQHNMNPDELEKNKRGILRAKENISSISVKSKPLIRLLGDTICDRGNNDYFIYLLLDKLDKEGVPVEIIISDHDMDAIVAFEKYQEESKDDFKKLVPPTLWSEPSLCNSFNGLVYLIKQGILNYKEVKVLAKRAHKDKLKIISYSLNNDINEITLYSHAPIGLDTLLHLADQLDIPRSKKLNGNSLPALINEINEKFNDYISKKDEVSKLYSEVQSLAGFGKLLVESSKENAFTFVQWNRKYYLLNRLKELDGWKIKFVHGHDNQEIKRPEHVFCLDTALGKASMDKDTYEPLGKYYYPEDEYCTYIDTKNGFSLKQLWRKYQILYDINIDDLLTDFAGLLDILNMKFKDQQLELDMINSGKILAEDIRTRTISPKQQQNFRKILHHLVWITCGYAINARINIQRSLTLLGDVMVKHQHGSQFNFKMLNYLGYMTLLLGIATAPVTGVLSFLSIPLAVATGVSATALGTGVSFFSRRRIQHAKRDNQTAENIKQLKENINKFNEKISQNLTNH